MKRIPLVDLNAQYAAIKEGVDSAIGRVISTASFVLGDEVLAFEEEFARFVETRFAVGVGSGLDALTLSLRALGIGRGAEVIVPANTFIATALAVSATGARPVLVDCDASTYCLDPALAEAALTDRTRAIVPVHLMGRTAEMDAILELGKRHHLVVVEDSAQAHGATFGGRAAGSIGAAGCFSFYPGKNLGAYGDGGAVTTSDELLTARLRSLRDYGQRRKYEHVEPGVNSRLDSLQAAVLRVKLRHLPEWNATRAAHARRYRELLDGVGDLAFQREPRDGSHVYHLFVVETGQRDELREHLAEVGIETGIHYPTPIHLQEAYRDLGYAEGAFPHSERLARTTLSLPMYPELTEEQIGRVATEVERFFAGASTASASRGL